jgi:hypothetical protein
MNQALYAHMNNKRKMKKKMYLLILNERHKITFKKLKYFAKKTILSEGQSPFLQISLMSGLLETAGFSYSALCSIC